MTEASNSKTSPFVPVALVVEDDVMQREMVAECCSQSEMGVIQCENAEAALDVLEKMGALFVDDVYRRQPHRPH